MKVLPRYIGPFPVMEVVNAQAYRLKLPANMLLHNVFHVSLLEPYHEDEHYQPPPATVFIEGDVQYDVAETLDVRSSGSRRQFGKDTAQLMTHGKTKIILPTAKISCRSFGLQKVSNHLLEQLRGVRALRIMSLTSSALCSNCTL